ncbi:MAG: hypothetical protein ACYDHY_09660 [Acidiferrobacterales bacterium]
MQPSQKKDDRIKVTNALMDEIAAALALSGQPLAAQDIARRCPSARETHQVSCILYELRKAGRIERANGSGRPRYRLARGVKASRDAVLRVGRRENEFREAESPRTGHVRAEIIHCLRAAGRALTKREIRAECPSARSGHEISQQIHVLVRERVLEAAVEPNGRRRLYWVVPSRQEELDFHAPGPVPGKPSLHRTQTGWSLRFANGAFQASHPLPGLRVDLDGQGRLVGITISDALLGR